MSGVEAPGGGRLGPRDGGDVITNALATQTVRAVAIARSVSACLRTGRSRRSSTCGAVPDLHAAELACRPLGMAIPALAVVRSESELVADQQLRMACGAHQQPDRDEDHRRA
jgi:hypothetical protein